MCVFVIDINHANAQFLKMYCPFSPADAQRGPKTSIDTKNHPTGWVIHLPNALRQCLRMGIILQLSKTLLPTVEYARVPGVEVRHFRGPEDIPAWIELRNRAFARETVGVRQWDEADFRTEILDKPWWAADRFWFAVATPESIKTLPSTSQRVNLPLANGANPSPQGQVIGAVVLADRGPAEKAQAAIHWLIVAPLWRRRGVGRLLIETLEARAWELGHRHVVLETHAAWRSAAQFYERLGYVPTRAF